MTSMLGGEVFAENVEQFLFEVFGRAVVEYVLVAAAGQVLGIVGDRGAVGTRDVNCKYAHAVPSKVLDRVGQLSAATNAVDDVAAVVVERADEAARNAVHVLGLGGVGRLGGLELNVVASEPVADLDELGAKGLLVLLA